MNTFALILMGLGVAVALFIGSICYLYFFRLWFRTHIAQCSLPLTTIFALFFRRSNPALIVGAYITAHKAGISLALEDLEAHYKDKGDVKAVVQAAIAAQDAEEDISFEALCAQDLAKT